MRKALLLLSCALAAYAVFTLCSVLLLSDVKVHRGYVDAYGVPVYCVQWLPSGGNVKGTVVLLHGLGGSVEMMSWLGVELARNGFRVVAWDNLGHGRSASRLQPFNAAEAVRIYYAVLNALGVGEKDRIVLIGHSMGGYFAQEIAKLDPRVEMVVVVASRPYLNSSIKKVAVLAAFDEIFSFVRAEGWDTVLLPRDDHLTVLYNPAAINAILGRVAEEASNLASLRLALTVARSFSALAAMLSLFHLLGNKLSRRANAIPNPFSYRAYTLVAALCAPLAFPIYALLNPIASLVAAYVLALLCSQAIGLAAMYAMKRLLKVELPRGLDLAKRALLSLLLALVAYASLHESLQPFFNVEPSVYRLRLLAVVFALSLPPAFVFEATLRRSLQGEPTAKGLLKVAGLRATSFASAYVAARLAIGAQGLSGYLLVVTYVSLCLILPLDAAAQVWLRRSQSWFENVIWLSLTQSLLLTAVTPLT